jgi:Xaa-Pro aminopeptidase
MPRLVLCWIVIAVTAAACGLGANDSRSASTASPMPDFCGTEIVVPGSRERFAVKNAIVQEKLDTALLPAMRNHGVDMWIVLDRENNVEPLHEELGGGFAGVRGAFIFYDSGGARPEKLYYSSHEQPATSVITRVYDEKKYYGYSKEGLTPLLRDAVRARNPKRIGVNTSSTLPEADGLTVGLRDFLLETIGPELASRLVSAELLVRDYRTNRTPLETRLYTQLLQWSARWMCEALSIDNITPGKTTAEDIAWWLEDRALALGLTGSGTPRVVRRGELLPLNAAIAIEGGDIISIDGGLDYLGFETDIKRAVYVAVEGESAPPAGLAKAWQDTLKIAALYQSHMKPKAIGHQVWEALRAETEKRGYATAYPDAGGRAAVDTVAEVGIYGHSVGNVAHDIGARIAQDLPFAYGDRVRFPLRHGEWVSVEFHVSTPIPEWGGKTWYARFEETGRVGDNGVEWLIPYQDRLLIAAGSSGATASSRR